MNPDELQACDMPVSIAAGGVSSGPLVWRARARQGLKDKKMRETWFATPRSYLHRHAPPPLPTPPAPQHTQMPQGTEAVSESFLLFAYKSESRLQASRDPKRRKEREREPRAKALSLVPTNPFSFRATLPSTPSTPSSPRPSRPLNRLMKASGSAARVRGGRARAGGRSGGRCRRRRGWNRRRRR